MEYEFWQRVNKRLHNARVPIGTRLSITDFGRKRHSKSFQCRRWIFDLETAFKSEDQDMVYSGAIAANLESIFVALGSGELICLRVLDGKEVWRTSTKNPLRGGPTVSGGRVFVVTIDNKTLSFDAKTGKLLWSHAGTTETAALIGGC